MIPARLLTNVSAGPWIRLYSFDSTAVSQRAAADDLLAEDVRGEGARHARRRAGDAHADDGDRDAAALRHGLLELLLAAGRRRRRSSTRSTSCDLLNSLSTADARFADAAKRFGAYLRQPPAFRLEQGPLGALRFWLSKPATVTAYSAAGRTQRYGMRDGWHTIGWAEPRAAGHLPDPRERGRLGRQPLVVRRAADRPGRRRRRSAATVGRPRRARRSARRSSSARASTIPSRRARAQKLGLHLVRIAVDWPTGATTPELALVAALRQLTGSQVLLELRTAATPTDDSTRTALAQYAAALVQQVPGMRYLTLAPAVAAAGIADYAAAYVAVHDAVKAALPGVALAPLVDGSSSPKTTLTALARALPAEDVDVFAFRPAGATAAGWTADDVPQLLSTLDDVFGRAPPLLIDGARDADDDPVRPARVVPEDPAARPVRGFGEGPGQRLRAADQLDGVLDDDQRDRPRPARRRRRVRRAGERHRLRERRRRRRRRRSSRRPPARPQRGTVVCPGLASRSGASTLEFPTELDASASASVVLGCVRDCLYVITLADGSGRPVAARRGTLTGGGRPITLELPKAKLSAAGYRFDVRIVDRVNPGEVSRTTSELLPVSR